MKVQGQVTGNNAAKQNLGPDFHEISPNLTYRLKKRIHRLKSTLALVPVGAPRRAR
jgi:hypothetical protein